MPGVFYEYGGCLPPQEYVRLESNLEEEWVLAGHAGLEGRVIKAERRACAKVQSPQCPHLFASPIPSHKKKRARLAL